MNDNTKQLAGFKKNEEESSLLMLIISCVAYALLLSLILGDTLQITQQPQLQKSSLHKGCH
jgi:FtsH-binding integral membrane protein